MPLSRPNRHLHAIEFTNLTSAPNRAIIHGGRVFLQLTRAPSFQFFCHLVMQDSRSEPQPNDSSVPTPRARPLGLDVVMIAILMAAALWMLGRTPWCQCGEYSPWSWDINSQHNSQHLIDPYFFTHVLHGVLFFAALWPLRHRLSDGIRLKLAVVFEAAWEILENTPLIIERYRATTISLDYYGDSIANSVFDLLACITGYAIASRLRWTYSLALLIVVEVVLLATIRDSLLLNVIMLVWPSDAILQWQSG
ncbi:hypothetical protein TBK1r_40510 [Stieleria magnilauensis]|uniref:DUF2585 family protein n=2 Tax=Stieleria magnilauensis TaxID=2527963 RepID=A0ABX5XU23_9BACT|nr:hypothetical protein TBK1r_40510 [Planctomycetes bacterium TBK1r]